jgi:Co/Zn/Cd efflux system component
VRDPGAPGAPGAGDLLIACDPIRERRTLKILLAVNATMFVIGLAAAVARSTGLLADSLDTFADAAVFSLSLYGVGRSNTTKLRADHISGWLQATLALATLGEVVRRTMRGGEVEAPIFSSL